MHAKKTQLVQRNIGNPTQAVPIFNAEHGDTVPIVLVPQGRSCCSCFYRIPSGINTIVHNCGDDAFENRIAPPGLQLCKPFWNHVAYMVTQQACTYNAPVKSCPTQDNVMVDCELTLVFTIGSQEKPQEVKKFVYNLGALKFNEYLAAECDESIRQLIRATPLSDVYELRGSGSEHVQNVLHVLNAKFNDFGVSFSKAAITDVVLNDELRNILQGTTEFRTKIKELDKEHEHNMKLIKYDYQQKLSEKERVYDRRIQDIEADIQVALVNRKRDVVNAESRREVAVTKEQENTSVQKKRAESELSVAVVQAKQKNADLLAKIKSDAESRKIKIDKETEVEIFESQQLIKVSENKSLALSTEAKAEGDAADALRVIREHNLEMAKLEVTESIAKKAKIYITGDNGDRLIGSILDKDLLGGQVRLRKKNNN